MRLANQRGIQRKAPKLGAVLSFLQWPTGRTLAKPILSLILTASLLPIDGGLRPALADKLIIKRQILLPGDKPAAGARVLLRSLNTASGTLKQDMRLVADGDGRIDAVMEVDKSDFGSERNNGYLMIDSPDAALTFEEFSNLPHHGNDRTDLIRASAGFPVTGKVVTNQGTPVAGARIVVHGFSAVPLNVQNLGIGTPEMTGQSQADGSYTLRSMAFNLQTFGNGDPVIRLVVSATTTINGETWMGWTQDMVVSRARTAADKPDPFAVLTLYPTARVHGKVVRQTDHSPVEGAIVRLVAHPNGVVGALPPVTTDGRGMFEFRDVPAVFQLFAEVSHPALSNGWTRIGEDRLAIFNRNAIATKIYDQVNVRLRSLAILKGRLVEEATGQPPSVEPGMKQHLSAVYEEGYNDGYISVGHSSTQTVIGEDGRFEIKVAAGYNQLLLFSNLYRPLQRPAMLDVPASGVNDWVFRVAKQPSFYVRFKVDDPAALTGVEVFKRSKAEEGDGSQVGFLRDGYWARATQNWGDKTQIRLMRLRGNQRQELLPWTELTADEKQWPREISLTLDNRITVRGRVLNVATGAPMPGVKVQLVGIPQEEIRKLEATTSDNNGRFTFDKIPLPQLLYVEAVHPEMPGDRVQVGGSPLAVKPGEPHQVVGDIVLKVRPWTHVSGSLIDADTNKTPVLFEMRSTSRKATIKAVYDQGVYVTTPNGTRQELTFRIPPAFTAGEINADGSFNLKVPAGSFQLLADVPNYVAGAMVPDFVVNHSVPGHLVTRLEAPIEGLTDVVVKVTKYPNFVFRFECDDPTRLKGAVVYVRNSETAREERWGTIDAERPRVFTLGTKWGATKQVRVLGGPDQKELLPWTQITADPANWPLVIHIP